MSSQEEFFGDDPADADSDEEAAAKSRPPINAVRPIRDVPDEYVFRFEVGPAILAQLLEKLNKIAIIPLSEAKSAQYPGFYQIFLNGDPKYVGKSSRPLHQRLREHYGKLSRRLGINISDVGCRYAFVEDPSLVDVAEGALISFFSQYGLTSWNQTGFGSKVTGYRRGDQEASEWARQYPPDLDTLITAGSDRSILLWNLVRSIKKQAPLTFAVPQNQINDFKSAHRQPLDIGLQDLSFREWANLIESFLKPGWEISRKAESWYVSKKR